MSRVGNNTVFVRTPPLMRGCKNFLVGRSHLFRHLMLICYVLSSFNPFRQPSPRFHQIYSHALVSSMQSIRISPPLGTPLTIVLAINLRIHLPLLLFTLAYLSPSVFYVPVPC